MRQDPIKHLWWSFCCKNSLLLSGVIFAKSFIIDVLKVPKYVSEYINPGDIDLFKVVIEALEKGVKYVQS